MEILLKIILLISSFYIVVGLTTMKIFTVSLEYPLMDFFGRRKITRVLDKTILYLSILTQLWFWLYK